MNTNDTVFQHALGKLLAEIFDGPTGSEAYLLDDVSAAGALSSAGHTAYHLGAIRQILAALGTTTS